MNSSTALATKPNSGNPNWRAGMLPVKTGRNSTKTLQGFFELRDRLAQHVKAKHGLPDFDCMIAMVEMGCDVTNPPELRFRAMAEIAKYTYPTLKQVEVTGKDGGAIEHKTTVVDALLGALLNGTLQSTVIDAVVSGDVADATDQ